MARESFFSRLGRGIRNILGIPASAPKPPPQPQIPTEPPPVPPAYQAEPPPPPPEPAQPDAVMPPTMFGGGGQDIRDDYYIDSDDEREQYMGETVEDFIDQYGYPDEGIEVSFDADFTIADYDLGVRSPTVIFYGNDAAAFLDNPSYTSILNSYVTGSGFSVGQWISGMGNVTNLTIRPI